MGKKILIYTIAFFLLLVVLLFFNKTYRELTNYSELTNRHNTVYNCFQNLSNQISKAAIINPDMVNANNPFNSSSLFFTDSLIVVQQINLLKSTVRDSVNIQIATKLDTIIRSELSWLLKSNVPDSIIHHQSAAHIASLQSIDSLIDKGINRTVYLIEYRKKLLHEEINKVRTWMGIFIIVSGILLIYTTVNLFRQKNKTKTKEKELQTVFNRISDGVVSVDNNWRYTFLNDAAMATLPLYKKEAIGKSVWDVYPEIKGTIFWDKYQEAMLTKKAVEIENYYPPMNVWFSAKIYPSADGLTIFYKDITENKKAVEQLSQTLREVSDYKFALDESSIVAITDQRGIINYVNDNFCKVSKYSREELIGQDHRIINAGYHSKEFIKNLWDTIENGKIWKGGIKNKAKNGNTYWVDTTIVPFLNDQGKPYQYVAIKIDITERKKAEDEILLLNTELDQKVQERTKELVKAKNQLSATLERVSFLASIAENIQDPVIATDNNYIITKWNNAAEKLLEWKSEEVIGKISTEILQGIYPDLNRDDIIKLLQEKHFWQGEIIYHTRWGRPVNVLATISHLKDAEENITGNLLLIRDITDRKKTEDALNKLNEELEQRVKERTENLAASEKRFRSLIENSVEGITMMSGDFYQNLYRSPAAEKITGSLPRVNTVSRTHPDDHEKIKKVREQVLQNPGVPIAFEGRFLHVQGHYFWMEGTFTNLLHVNGVNSIVVNFRDITQRKEAEEKLIKSEKIYKTIASSIPGSVICLLDSNFRYLLIEGDMLENLGYKKEKLLGNKAADVLPEAIFAAVQDQFISAFNGETVTRESISNGYDIISRFIPLKDETNLVYAIMTVSIDVTELKNAQRDIAELNKNLEEKITERTKQLKKINEELEAFSYSVSHDLRAPLRAVNGYARILEEDYKDLFDSEGHRLLGEVQQNAKKMGVLIDDLLSFSRLGRKEVEKSIIDMNKLAEHAIQEINQATIHQAEIKIDPLIAVNGDYSLMLHVMVNLISNAVKYSSKKEKPVIEIKSAQVNGEITYTVSDNGVGFEMAYVHKLFGVFQRLHTNEEFPGTGVGLAIVQRIINKHQGKIWAEAKPGEGATFYFTLPSE